MPSKLTNPFIATPVAPKQPLPDPTASTTVPRITRSMARTSLENSPNAKTADNQAQVLWPFPLEILSLVIDSVDRCQDLSRLQRVNSGLFEVASARLFKRCRLPVWGRPDKVEVRPLGWSGGDSLIASLEAVLRMAVHVQVLELNLELLNLPRISFAHLPMLPNLNTLFLTMLPHQALSVELAQADLVPPNYRFFLGSLRPRKLVLHRVSLYGASKREREFKLLVPPEMFPNVKEYTFTLASCHCDLAPDGFMLSGGLNCLASLAGPQVETVNMIIYHGPHGQRWSPMKADERFRNHRNPVNVRVAWVGVVFRDLAAWMAKQSNPPTFRVINLDGVDFSGIDFDNYKADQKDPAKTPSEMVEGFFRHELFKACKPTARNPNTNVKTFADVKACFNAKAAKVSFHTGREYLSTTNWGDEFAPDDPFVRSAFGPDSECMDGSESSEGFGSPMSVSTDDESE